MRRVTGIGGIFFHAKDPVALQAWYKQHLGIDVQEWGGVLEKTEDSEYGKFGWVIDLDGEQSRTLATALRSMNHRVHWFLPVNCPAGEANCQG